MAQLSIQVIKYKLCGVSGFRPVSGVLWASETFDGVRHFSIMNKAKNIN